jgi:acyl-CoA thioesterase FadM
MSHRVSAGDERRLVADVASVLVTYDYESASPIPVPADWRARMGAYEGRRLETQEPRAAAAAG